MHVCMYVWMYVYVSVYIYAHADAPTHLCLNLRSVTSFTERRALARSRWAAARHGAKPGGPNGPNARSPRPHSRSRRPRSTLGRPLPHRRPFRRTACGCVCELAAPCVCARDISTRTLSHCACVRACVRATVCARSVRHQQRTSACWKCRAVASSSRTRSCTHTGACARVGRCACVCM